MLRRNSFVRRKRQGVRRSCAEIDDEQRRDHHPHVGDDRPDHDAVETAETCGIVREVGGEAADEQRGAVENAVNVGPVRDEEVWISAPLMLRISSTRNVSSGTTRTPGCPRRRA